VARRPSVLIWSGVPACHGGWHTRLTADRASAHRRRRREACFASCSALLIYFSPAPVALRPTRGDWQNFKREVQPYAAVFLHGPQPHILRIGAIMRQTA